MYLLLPADARARVHSAYLAWIRDTQANPDAIDPDLWLQATGGRLGDYPFMREFDGLRAAVEEAIMPALRPKAGVPGADALVAEANRRARGPRGEQ